VCSSDLDNSGRQLLSLWHEHGGAKPQNWRGLAQQVPL
jgi:hypothetical protein